MTSPVWSVDRGRSPDSPLPPGPLPRRSGRFTYNAAPLTLGASLPAPGAADLPRVALKGADLERVRSGTTDDVRAGLDAAALRGRHRRVAVDVKVSQVVPGRYPCLRGWHVDAVLDPEHASRPEVHHLFVSGARCLTELVASPDELALGPARSAAALLGDLNRQLAAIDPPVRSGPSCQVVEGGRFDLHRGARGRGLEARLLVRVSETNVVAPGGVLRRRVVVAG